MLCAESLVVCCASAAKRACRPDSNACSGVTLSCTCPASSGFCLTACCTTAYEQIRQFVHLSAGQTSHLNREQKGRFVCLCWIAQIYKHFPEPKAAYVADWEGLPGWQ